MCSPLPGCAKASMFPCYRGKGSGLKKDSFMLVFGLSCFDFFLYFYLKVIATWYVNILWVRSFCLHVWKIKAVEILVLNSTEMANKENIFCFNLGAFFSVCNTDRLTLAQPL